MLKARISEIFESFQGEGLYLGEEQLFVRFFGCNLACRFCDTKLKSFKEYEPQELFEEIISYKNKFHSLSFTGGEPLLHNDFLKEVLALTRKNGYKNYLDTNGTLPGELKQVIPYLDIIAMDLKLPSSTGLSGLWGMHRKFLEIASQKETFIKTIICETTQEEDLRQAVDLIKGIDSSITLILQPNGYDNYALLKEKLEKFKNIAWENGITACIVPQVHRMLGFK